MAKKTWAVHIAAHDGMDSFGFSSKEDAEGFRKDAKGGVEFASTVIPLVSGKNYWVVHVRMADGKMKSFGFKDRAEALKFHKALFKGVSGFDVASFPTRAQLTDDKGVLDWTPDV
jgi:hypothetical protein